ncbi:AvrE-family type 3 secretion system effector [Pseudomonas sp. NPDC090202]|uniref:AvrE-family type 3 secretion system effector n=1 Tax=unclassified Pseudomonas TaxID=196821 RepID=UPI0038299F4B
MPLQFLPSRATMQQLGASIMGRQGVRPPDEGPNAGAELQPLGPRRNIGMSIGGGGRVELTDRSEGGRLGNEQRLLDEILNKPGQSFERYQRDGRLIDRQGFTVKADAAGHSVYAFVSSRPHRAETGAQPVGVFDRTHQGQKSGIFQSADGQAWTLHDKRLYRFDDAGSWQADALPEGHDGKFKALTQKGDDVFAMDEQGSVWQLGGATPAQVPFAHPVSAIAAQGEHWLGVAAHGDSFHLHESGANGRATELTVGGRQIGDAKADKPSAIGLAGRHLLMIDGGGRLHIGAFPHRSQWPAQLNLRAHAAERLATEGFGQMTFSALFNDLEGNLHARFKDGHGKEHTAQWNPALGDFESGWNLSQSTAVVKQNGLPAITPDAHERIHLDGGSVAQKDGQLLVHDPRTGAWGKGSEADLQDLHQGNDGFAYIVSKEGAVKRLAVQAQALSRTLGSGPDLTVGHGTEAKAGATLRGAHDVVAEKLAVLNDDRYVTLSDGHLRTHDQRGTVQELPPLPGLGDYETLGIPDPHDVDQRHIQDLSIADGNLYVLKAGTLYRMDAGHWQGGKQGVGVHHQDQSAWTPIDLPGGVTPESIRTSTHGELLVRHGGTEQRLEADGSLGAATADNPRLTTQHALHERLAEREQTLGSLARHGNLKVGASVFGRNGMETVKPKEAAPTSLQYVKSHVRLKAALQKPFDKATHAIKGRQGLADVYQQEADLLTRLDQRRRLNATGVPAMATHLAEIRGNARFAMNPKVELLTDVIEQVSKSVTEDTERVLRSLAQDHGAVGSNGQVNPDYRPAKPVANDLLFKLEHSLAASGVAGSGLNRLLGELRTQRFQVGHRDPQKGRDAGDPQALAKARLALNADVLFQLKQQLELLSRASREGNTSESLLDGMANTLEQTYAKGYLDDPLRKYTDAGFRSHRELEASYDASKTLLKYFRDPKHPLTQNLRVGMDVAPARIGEELTTALRQLKPRENLKISRNYAGNVNGGVSGAVTGPAYLGGRFNLEPERTYGLTFTRYERGLKVAINRDGAFGGGGNVGFGAGIADHQAPKQETTANLLQNSSWFGISADLKYKYTQSNAMSFFVRDEDIEAFVQNLVSTPLQKSGETERAVTDRMHPLDFLDDSTEQELRTGSKHNADLDLNLGAEYRLNDGQIGAQPVKGFMRFSAGATGNANLASFERERVQGRGSDGLRTDIRTDNRVRFLEKGGVTAYARLFDAAFSSQPNHVFISGGVPLGVSVNVALDNKTGKAFDVRFKDTLPVLTAETKALASSLEKAFPLIAAPDLAGQNARQQLATLEGAYNTAAPASPLSNAQYSALNSLRQTQRQDQAAQQNTRLMTTMDFITKQSNVNRIDHASYSKRATDPVRQWLSGHTNPGNAEKVAAFMAQDAQLSGLIKELQNRNGATRAEIKMEVTDDAKTRIDREAIAGSLNDASLKQILGDPQNLRIKSISVFRNAGKEDAFTLPGVWVNYRSGSNLSVERLRGEITFDYAQGQHQPVGYKMEGQMTAERNTPTLTDLADAARGGYRPT